MITNVQLYAERHTGSKWITSMLKSCYNIENPCPLGWKHWFPEYDKINEINQSEYLFIVLSRNPYDWVAKMNVSPHHTTPAFRKLDIDTFIKKEWFSVWEKYDIPWINDDMEGTEMMHERNPDNGERIKNVVELRNYKNREFLSLKEKVSYVKYIKYEDLMINGRDIINGLSKEFPIRLNRGANPHIQPSESKKLSESAIQFINDNINWNLEEQLGYKKIDR